ncbi:GTP-binding protein [Luteococcus sediminum]
MRRGPLAVVLLATIDPTVRDLASLALACDLGDGVEVRHELVAGADGPQEVRCTVSDITGVVFTSLTELDHGCLSCTAREGLVPTLQWVAEQGRWSSALVTLPVGAANEQVAQQLQYAIDQQALQARLAHSLAVVDPETLVDDLLGGHLLAERGLALSEHDARAVGEALSAQLDAADTVVTLDHAQPQASSLLEHVLPPEVHRVTGLHRLDVGALLAGNHDVEALDARLAPSRRRVRCHEERDGVWTVVLDSTRAFHPQRLLDQVELLGSGPVRARGCFWLPSRPDAVCVWDGSGGQLSIGEVGHWCEQERRTRLVVTGTCQETRGRIERAFRDVLLSEHEQSSAAARWAGRSDGLEAWLGEVELPQAG